MAFLNDGFSTTINFNILNVPTVFRIHEKTVTPPGMSGGGPIDTTTMRNIALRTKFPKKLRTMDGMSLTCSYDPSVIVQAFNSLININQLIVVNFPDTSAITFFGYVDDLKPQENREGEQPLVSMTIVCTNVDLNGVETVPVFVPAA